ncbi:hypothetical protein J0J26_20580 [Vibrio vulnificus]|uniref:hypothetical protein n=1 Tax=Vibrio vulnificus TaxID=672 RepID=UPI0019D4EDB2|nr:hypothetical protein [Vibrio vulnificus]MBN8090485.1 hypothetical protein [Vibrio vulnificus]MBN8119330.1 hypothetical protein [Vibrio vulnificus]
MEHGALSPQNLKDCCFIVGRAFGVRNLGRLLYEITLVESNAGQRKSAYGGVCSISHYMFSLMQQHHGFTEYQKEIKRAFNINIKSVKFAQLASNPNLSLIVAGAWVLANVDSVPKKRIARARLYAKWWRQLPVAEYMQITNEQD